MPVFTFHLAETSLLSTVSALLRPPTSGQVQGLQHAECMTTMKLGSPVFSPSRLQLRRFAMFASWDNEDAVDDFLANNQLGRQLAEGWHVRLEFLRRWGQVSEFEGLPSSVGHQDADAPVVAVTLARLKHSQVPRFIKWGKPVERLVRDHPGVTLALAAARPARTVSTFSVWKSQREMTDMVHGHSAIADPGRHAHAMVERSRKDFHYEFTTLRFRCVGEYGEWEGRTNIVPVV